jgi:hypothetical protein
MPGWRGQVLPLRDREFVLAARGAGASTWDIAVRHLLRNVFPVIVVQASLDVGYAILFTSSLSFLGLGAQPPTPEWGAMMTDARGFLEDFWWYPMAPGLALAVTVLGFNLVGDGLRTGWTRGCGPLCEGADRAGCRNRADPGRRGRRAPARRPGPGRALPDQGRPDLRRERGDAGPGRRRDARAGR